MSITRSSLTGEADLTHIAQLFYDVSTHAHVTDMPYRISSWPLNFPSNVSLWHDEQEQLIACAIAQESFLTLDYVIRPEAFTISFEEEIWQWGLDQCPAIVARQRRTFPLFVVVDDLPEQAERLQRLRAFGFDWSELVEVYLTRSLHGEIPSPQLPDGFVERPLHSTDIPAYVTTHQAAFNSQYMRRDWRERTLQRPQYRAELDRVIVAPDGRLAAFAVGWLHPEGHKARVEPMGVHPDFQRRGLGRAVLYVLLQQMQLLGAQSVSVQTTESNAAARRLYESVGFQYQQRRRGLGRLFRPE